MATLKLIATIKKINIYNSYLFLFFINYIFINYIFINYIFINYIFI